MTSPTPFSDVLSCTRVARFLAEHVTMHRAQASPYPQPSANISSSTGNTYKNMYEATTMSSGLFLVVLINIVVAWLGVLFYRYVILREAGLLTPEDVRLLKKYPSVRAAQTYTPTDAYVRAAAPMRWTGWRAFFTASDSALSRDGQVYLLFQRACILTTLICALFASFVLVPSYWWGGVFEAEGRQTPHSLMSLLKSDRGIFERFTSHNLPANSPLLMLQLPVIVVTALCVIVLYTVVKAAAGEQRSLSEWLEVGSSAAPSTSSQRETGESSAMQSASSEKASTTLRSPVAGKSYWTLFARGLPDSLQSADELAQWLEAIYPNQVLNVELVCKGRMSEARLLRSLSSARNRLDYLYDNAEDVTMDNRLSSHTLFGWVFGLFAKKRTREQLIHELEEKIAMLRNDCESRKNEPVRDFLGCAFISFRSSTAAASALRDFPVRIGGRSVNHPSRSEGEERETGGEEGDEVRIAELTIGRHQRMSSEWGIPKLSKLYKGAVNLLPLELRKRVASSESFEPVDFREQRQSHERLAGLERQAGIITAEFATSKLRHMKAERAPKSGDVVWSNIGISFFERTVREILVQLLVFTFLILFTSPVAMLTALKLVFAEVSLVSDPATIFGARHHNFTSSAEVTRGSLNEGDGLSFLTNLTSDDDAIQSISQDFIDFLPSFLTKNVYLRSAILAYLPVLLLSVVFSIVPTLLRYTCALEGYPTRSAQEMSVFRKTAFYYVMNSVVLPSLALNTASEFLEMVYDQSGGGASVYDALPILQKLFSGDIAFFLCNYLVQLALTGSVFWLMRVPSSFSMMVRRRMALTPLEAAEAKCTDIFDYPRHYAYSVTVISMCLLFGYMAPLIWWFAALYFVCKHAVDLYLIRYVHPRSHIDGRLPRLSSNFILTWATVSQLSLAAIFYLQGWVRAGIATALVCLFMLASCLSVHARVGNRIMRHIASIRDIVVEKFMGMGVGGMLWMPMSSLESSTGSSGSAHSLAEAQESDSLLSRVSVMRSTVANAANAEGGGDRGSGGSDEQAGSEDSSENHSVQKDGMGKNSARHGEVIHQGERAAASDSDEDGLNGELDFHSESNSPLQDVEDGSTRLVAEYGTCGSPSTRRAPSQT